MANALSSTGLTTATRAELIASLTASFQTIYGSDIDLSSNSPDGQMLNIFVQSVLDVEDLLAQIYNSFDPDNAIGAILDQRVAINGIQRQAGTYSTQLITVTVGQALNIYGLDQNTQPVYTVADNAGNRWQLLTTHNFAAPGSASLLFQAAIPGAIQSAINTITVPVTIVLGVTSVNNPTTYTTLGLNEETDAVLKIRRQKSVSLASQGFLAGMLAAVKNVTGVTSAFVYENTGSATNVDGVPGHSIWVIVAGNPAAADIAQAIYTKRNAGCGMFGASKYIVTQVDGSQFVIAWDAVVTQDLFITAYASSIDGVNAPNLAGIRSELPALFVPGVYGEVNVNALATAIQTIDPNCLITFSGSGTPATGGFSTSIGGTYTNTLTPSTKNKQFVVSSPKIVLLPMILTPTTSTVVHGNTKQFTGLGGYGTLTYSILVNNSGGSINGATGLYTAGSTPSVTDTVKVIDSLGNLATATVTVT